MFDIRKNLSSLAASSFAATALTLGMAAPASSQLLPEVWGAFGARDNDFSYAAGAKWSGFALEVGVGEEGAVGGDFLTFFPFPIVSPYVGLGLYSSDDVIAFSGGAHIKPGGRIFFGAGYHSVRGINGKIGFRF